MALALKASVDTGGGAASRAVRFIYDRALGITRSLYSLPTLLFNIIRRWNFQNLFVGGLLPEETSGSIEISEETWNL